MAPFPIQRLHERLVFDPEVVKMMTMHTLPTRLLLLSMSLACSSASAPTNVQAGLSATAMDALTSDARRAVEQSTLPVLLLPARFGEATRAVAGPRFLTLNAPDGDVTVMLQVSNVVHHGLPEGATVPAPETEVRGVPARTGLNEGIRFVTWGERGAFYSLEVECHSMPLEDVRCASEGFALDLADELVAVGGTQ